MTEILYPILYLFAAALYILALKWMNSPATARRGVWAGETGMLLAVVGTLLRFEVVEYHWIMLAFLVGAAIGAPLALKMPMTAVPQRTAIAQAFGALAAALIGTAELFESHPHGFTLVALTVEMLLGYVTFTASLVAFGKLQELLPGRPMTYRGQNIANLSVLAIAIALGVAMNQTVDPTAIFPFFVTSVPTLRSDSAVTPSFSVGSAGICLGTI